MRVYTCTHLCTTDAFKEGPAHAAAKREEAQREIEALDAELIDPKQINAKVATATPAGLQHQGSSTDYDAVGREMQHKCRYMTNTWK